MAFTIELVSNHVDHTNIILSKNLEELRRQVQELCPNFGIARPINSTGYVFRFYKIGHPIVLGTVRYRPGPGVYEVESRFFTNKKTRDYNFLNVSKTKDLSKAVKLVKNSFILLSAREVSRYMLSTIEENIAARSSKAFRELYKLELKYNQSVRELNNGQDQYRVAVGQMEFPDHIKNTAHEILDLSAEVKSIDNRTCSLYIAVFNELNGKHFADTSLLANKVNYKGINFHIQEGIEKRDFVFTESSAPDWFKERVAKLQMLEVNSPILNIGCKHDDKVYTLYVENDEDKVEVDDGTK